METTVETTVETILKFIENGPSITPQQMMQKLKLTRQGVEWNIMKLKEKGVIIRRGPSTGISKLLANTLIMLYEKNFNPFQLSQNLRQLLLMVKYIRLSIITSI